MGEVHDAHDAEDEREADGDQRVDTAEEQRRDDELGERAHVRRGARRVRGAPGVARGARSEHSSMSRLRYLRWSQAGSGSHLVRLLVNSSGHTVTSSPFCHWSM